MIQVNAFGVVNPLKKKINEDGAVLSVEMNTKDSVSPCSGVCSYEDIDGEPRCISCWRTYEDLDQWSYMTNEERRYRMKQIKQEKKLYENKQKNNANMGR